MLKDRIKRLLKAVASEREEVKSTHQGLILSITKGQKLDPNVCITGLIVQGVHSKESGAFIIELSYPQDKELPDSSLKRGDDIILSCDKELIKGVIRKKDKKNINIRTNELPMGGGYMRIFKAESEITYVRMTEALNKLSTVLEDKRFEPILNILSKDSTKVCIEKQQEDKTYNNPSIDSVDLKNGIDSFKFYNIELNKEQKIAVISSTKSKDLSIIHGPPGTGKTSVILEILNQALSPMNPNTHKANRILVACSSNAAVDCVLERFIPTKYNVVRIGTEERMDPKVAHLNGQYQSRNSDEGELVTDIQREIKETISKYLKTKSRKEKYKLQNALKSLRQDNKKRTEKSIRNIMEGSKVFFSTLSSSCLIRDISFDLVIIDEASQATEPETWIGLLRGKRYILVGDHRQLPPTVISKDAKREGLEDSLFYNLIKRLGDLSKNEVENSFDAQFITKTDIEHVEFGNKTVLRRQYRMNCKIMDVVSALVYGGVLIADETVEDHLLCDLEGVMSNEITEEPLVLIDVEGGENQSSDSDSISNSEEAEVVKQYVEDLFGYGINPKDCAIISPYRKQVQLLKEMFSDYLNKGLEIGTVDGFQGREKEVIVISLVRCNLNNFIGFLEDIRRMNVALTRAKRQVCLICNADTLRKNSFYKKIIDYFEEFGSSIYM